ncbi:MAG: NAD-binding oxidoreductase, partial [Peptostreptococcaceae bacterium]|nr:NAD-binding oxidoreductase [Peptostreptococcaceae bacterium]
MYKIVSKRMLQDNICLMDVEAPRCASAFLPGQFLVVKIDEKGERIPLTICDVDKEKGTVTIVFQVLGDSTNKMVALNEGDYFEDFVGPLGNPSDLLEKSVDELKKMNIVFIAGGVGTAPIYPQVKYLHELGVECDVI